MPILHLIRHGCAVPLSPQGEGLKRAIRESPIRGLIFYRASAVRHCELNIKFIVIFEHFLLVCKRKAHEPFPLDTRPPPRKHAPGGSFLLARHMRPQTRFRSDSAGLCGRLCRPSPRRSQEVPPFALRLVGTCSLISAIQMYKNG